MDWFVLFGENHKKYKGMQSLGVRETVEWKILDQLLLTDESNEKKRDARVKQDQLAIFLLDEYIMFHYW